MGDFIDLSDDASSWQDYDPARYSNPAGIRSETMVDVELFTDNIRDVCHEV